MATCIGTEAANHAVPEIGTTIRVRLPTQAAWIPSHAILPLARP